MADEDEETGNKQAKVISPDGEKDIFEIYAGVLQGDTLFLFSSSQCWTLIVSEWSYRITGHMNLDSSSKPRQSGRIEKQTITDFGFANDLALLSDTVEQAQEILLALETKAAKVGLHINAKKTQYMSFNQTSNEPLCTMNGSKLQQAQDFKYLGA